MRLLLPILLLVLLAALAVGVMRWTALIDQQKHKKQLSSATKSRLDVLLARHNRISSAIAELIDAPELVAQQDTVAALVADSDVLADRAQIAISSPSADSLSSFAACLDSAEATVANAQTLVAKNRLL